MSLYIATCYISLADRLYRGQPFERCNWNSQSYISLHLDFIDLTIPSQSSIVGMKVVQLKS